jgi:AcrR family transcriptional regulator
MDNGNMTTKVRVGAGTSRVAARRRLGAARGDLSRKAGTASRIVEATAESIGAGGVVSLRLEQIAQRLDITVPAIYAHFPGGRSELIAAVEMCALRALSELFRPRASESAQQSLTRGLRELVQLITRQPAYMRVILLDFSYPGGLPEVTRRVGRPGQAEASGLLRPMYDRLTTLLAGATGRQPATLSPGLFFNSLLGAICLNILHPPFPGDATHNRKYDLEEEMVNLALCYLRKPTADAL